MCRARTWDGNLRQDILRAWEGAPADLDIDPLEEPAVYAKALWPEHVVGVVRVARRAAHEVDKRLPHHRVSTRLSLHLPQGLERTTGALGGRQLGVHYTHARCAARVVRTRAHHVSTSRVTTISTHARARASRSVWPLAWLRTRRCA